MSWPLPSSTLSLSLDKSANEWTKHLAWLHFLCCSISCNEDSGCTLFQTCSYCSPLFHFPSFPRCSLVHMYPGPYSTSSINRNPWNRNQGRNFHQFPSMKIGTDQFPSMKIGTDPADLPTCLFKKKGRPQASIGGVKFSNLMQFVVYWFVLVPFINISSITKLGLHFLALRSKAAKKLRITQAQAKKLIQKLRIVFSPM